MASEGEADTGRIEAFSDGVFAIAITLLVLTLEVPEVHGGLWRALRREWPQFAGYLTSFVIIGIMWVNHHSMFRAIVRTDRVLLFLNLLLLLWMAVLPFPTNLIAGYLGDGGPDAAVAEAIYSANLTLAAIAFSLIWAHAVRGGRLTAIPLSPRAERQAILRFSGGTIAYAATIGISFLSPGVALAIQFAVAAYYAFEQLAPAARPGD
jgi:uncharacterized membrane protein